MKGYHKLKATERDSASSQSRAAVPHSSINYVAAASIVPVISRLPRTRRCERLHNLPQEFYLSGGAMLCGLLVLIAFGIMIWQLVLDAEEKRNNAFKLIGLPMNGSNFSLAGICPYENVSVEATSLEGSYRLEIPAYESTLSTKFSLDSNATDCQVDDIYFNASLPYQKTQIEYNVAPLYAPTAFKPLFLTCTGSEALINIELNARFVYCENTPGRRLKNGFEESDCVLQYNTKAQTSIVFNPLISMAQSESLSPVEDPLKLG